MPRSAFIILDIVGPPSRPPDRPTRTGNKENGGVTPTDREPRKLPKLPDLHRPREPKLPWIKTRKSHY